MIRTHWRLTALLLLLSTAQKNIGVSGIGKVRFGTGGNRGNEENVLCFLGLFCLLTLGWLKEGPFLSTIYQTPSIESESVNQSKSRTTCIDDSPLRDFIK